MSRQADPGILWLMLEGATGQKAFCPVKNLSPGGSVARQGLAGHTRARYDSVLSSCPTAIFRWHPDLQLHRVRARHEAVLDVKVVSLPPPPLEFTRRWAATPHIIYSIEDYSMSRHRG